MRTTLARRSTALVATLILGSSLTLAGCGDDEDTPTVNEIEQNLDDKVEEGTTKLEEGADKVEEEAEQGADKIEEEASAGADKAEDAAGDAGDKLEEGAEDVQTDP